MGDLYRPLGLDRKQSRHRSRLVSKRGVLAACAGTLVLAGSLAASLGQPAFQKIDVFADAAKRADDAALQTASVAAPTPSAHDMTPLEPLGRSSLPLELRTSDDQPTISYPPDSEGSYGKLVAVADPGMRRQPLSSAASPDDALLEPGDEGPIPVRGPDGRRPFDVYQAQPKTDRGTRVAIVVGGLGISQTGTMKAIDKLPSGVTLAFAPAGNSLDRWMRQARQRGHEILLQLPMEPMGYPNISPGEHTLTAADAAAKQWSDLRWALGRVTNYVGVTNYMGARLTGDADAMRALSGELARRGLLYLDDGTSARSLARGAAQQAGGPFAASDIVLDAQQDADSIAQQLDALERTARAKGQAIATASAFETSVAAITAWAKQAEGRGIAIVPVSSLAADPEAM